MLPPVQWDQVQTCMINQLYQVSYLPRPEIIVLKYLLILFLFNEREEENKRRDMQNITDQFQLMVALGPLGPQHVLLSYQLCYFPGLEEIQICKQSSRCMNCEKTKRFLKSNSLSFKSSYTIIYQRVSTKPLNLPGPQFP